jgi:oligopeptide/dipeptide ABC transporter ATP-binding protein
VTGPDPVPPVLGLAGVGVEYGRGPANRVVAVDHVDLEVRRGTSVGIVGESGSGKTTVLRLLAGLIRPHQGSVRFGGRPLDIARRDQEIAFRKSVQLVFQDPASSLDPRRRIWELVSEPAWALTKISRPERRALTRRLLVQMGLPEDFADRRPHELSGGERQRVALARALSVEPDVVLLDEPVASLDASRRGQVINVVNRLRRDRGVTVVVVSHDLVPVALLTEVIVTMYRGRAIEQGPSRAVLRDPAHPYTRLLVATARDPLVDSGTDDDIRDVTDGACPYASRCPEYRPGLCDTAPELTTIGDHHQVACHVRVLEHPSTSSSTSTTT